MSKILVGILALSLTVLSGLEAHANQKIVYFISLPRSLSTAFLRMMDERGDFAIIHEPGVSAWDYIYDPEFANSFFRPNAPRTFQEVEDLVFQTSKQRSVFVKEMGFAAYEYLPQMPKLLESREAYFVFLVRNPHHSLISYYRKHPFLYDALPKVLSCKELYDLFKKIQSRASNPPAIVLAEELSSQSETSVQRFCHHIDIPFKEESLHWENLDEKFTGYEEWHENKHLESTQHWHKEALQSTGFGMPTKTYALDNDNKPTFEEIENPEHRQIYQKIYEDNLPYYKLLLAEYTNQLNAQ